MGISKVYADDYIASFGWEDMAKVRAVFNGTPKEQWLRAYSADCH